MKQSQNGRKGRPRPTGRKHRHNNDGNRLEQKARSNAKQNLEKYKTQGREALQAGDRVEAENYFQFADHYQRVINEARGLAKGLFTGEYMTVAPEDRPQRSHHNDSNDGGEAANNPSDGDNNRDDRQQNRRGRQVRGRRPRNTERNAERNSERGTERSHDRHQDRDRHAEKSADAESVNTAETPDTATHQAPVDLAGTEQPTEVHPELDINPAPRSSAAADDKPEDSQDKPKPRRGRPRKATPKDAATIAQTTASETVPAGLPPAIDAAAQSDTSVADGEKPRKPTRRSPRRTRKPAESNSPETGTTSAGATENTATEAAPQE